MIHPPTYRERLLRSAIAGLAGLALTLAAPAPLHAQSTVDSFAGFSSQSNKPIDIESDVLEVLDAKKVAIFRGNVKAAQGDMTLRSKEIRVKYTGERGQDGSGTEITSIRATGKVLINTKNNQSSSSEWALFDVQKQTVTIGGNVVLTQGENVIKGDRLVIDLKTGRSRFENPGDVSTGQRVRGLFMPKQSGAKGDAKKPGNSDTAAQ